MRAPCRYLVATLAIITVILLAQPLVGRLVVLMQKIVVLMQKVVEHATSRVARSRPLA